MMIIHQIIMHPPRTVAVPLEGMVEGIITEGGEDEAEVEAEEEAEAGFRTGIGEM